MPARSRGAGHGEEPSAPVKLRVSRGPQTILTHSSSLGQLFPGAGLAFRIPLGRQSQRGRVPRQGRDPAPAAPPRSSSTRRSPSARRTRAQLESRTTLGAPDSGTPLWMWVALGVAGLLVALLLFLLWRLERRPVEPVT